jgi:hypothetical protein
MNTTTAPHPLDDALALTALAPGQYQGRTTEAYWNMVGPYGGITAATLVQAILQHPECLGEPISLTVNYAAAVGAGPFTLQATPVRTNRSTQHWTLSIEQADASGALVVTTTGTAVTAVRRDTWSACDIPMPAVPPAQQFERAMLHAAAPQWIHRYEMRMLEGGLPTRWDGSGDGSLSRLWVRDAEPRALDFASITAMADVFFPRVWLRRTTHVPAGTVSMTVYFHATSAQLQATGSAPVLAQARGQQFGNGFFDQTAQLWNADGVVLATSHQIVYFKE